ncbi:FHA domain-containing protein [Pantoea sp. Tr-811]|uniref:FHA domain-containing protein n=1 Tax=Pantoea sp. Tr-811 TaxID=2608361 RepID=UPI00141FF032|nr:FHA domain-containing protein [Pantoea sp. Tr-811]NIF28996.1 FHA domain-containing protein [Pantoea sp. Tr-811]
MSTMTLSIINLGQVPQTVTARRLFASTGGTIGSNGADWLLDDRKNGVAPVHCEIRWTEGSFCVVDHCQRTYLNGSDVSLDLHYPTRLNEGDQLRIGAYRLHVRCATGETQPLEGLFNLDLRLLDEWIEHAHAQPWQPEAGPAQAFPEVCSAFAPTPGNDPLVALDAQVTATPSQRDPLQGLTAGERL